MMRGEDASTPGLNATAHNEWQPQKGDWRTGSVKEALPNSWAEGERNQVETISIKRWQGGFPHLAHAWNKHASKAAFAPTV
jgi:hypothetical protein